MVFEARVTYIHIHPPIHTPRPASVARCVGSHVDSFRSLHCRNSRWAGPVLVVRLLLFVACW